MSNETTVKRWTAKRKAAVVMDIFKGKTTVAEVARQHDLTVSEVEGWIDEAQRSMENGFRARPKDCFGQVRADTFSSRSGTLN
jgi:transposase-like protein